MQFRSRPRSWFRASTSLLLAGLGCLPAAIAPPAHGQAVESGPNSVPVSRYDIFGGYSYLNPVQANVGTLNFDKPIDLGAIVSVTRYFGNYLGLQAEGTAHPNGPNDCVFTAEAGPIVRYQLRRLVPFVHVLGGGVKAGGPDLQPCTWGYGVTGGLGVDYILHAFDERLAIRPIQADYNYNRIDYGPLLIPGAYSGGLMKMNAYTLSAGLVFRLGGGSIADHTRYAAALACTGHPDSVLAGETVTIDSNTTGIDPKRKATYTWTTTGGKIAGSGDTITIATDGLGPGTYTVLGRVVQGRRVYEQAGCTVEFEVKSNQPPTITCSALPSSVRPGESATISAVASSPSGRPLTYSYSTSAGQVTGDGPKATLNSGGAPPGAIVVTCNVVDDHGQSANTTAMVQVVPNPVQAAPLVQQLCSIDFARDLKRPARVNNEAKGCLDDIALTMQREGDSKLVMVGDGATPELAAERAYNAKLYLAREKGIDPARITLRVGQATDMNVSNTLVPAGATYDDSLSGAIDESTIQHRGEAYGIPHKGTAASPRKRRRSKVQEPATDQSY